MRKAVVIIGILIAFPTSVLAASPDLPPDPFRDRAAEAYVSARLEGLNDLAKGSYRGMLSEAFLWGWQSKATVGTSGE